MQTVAPSLAVTLSLAASATAGQDARHERQTVEAARVLAGPDVAGLPIELASVLPNAASKGAEGWTIAGDSGKGERIFVYTGSEIFRCASTRDNHECLLRLASILVHEAWHIRNGPREDEAYSAQIAFLIGNRVSSAQVAAVRKSRDRSLAAERKAIDAAKGATGDAPASDQDRVARQTLDAARSLVDGPVMGLPITLASTLPDGASRGVEGWTTFRADGEGERIFVYTESRMFRCASKGGNYQCLLRLASSIVHEAWHFENGLREDRAYAAQIAFLMGHQGAPEQIAAVRMSRDRVLAAQRRAIEAAKKATHHDPQ
jgi:hypothetical protein